MFQTRNEVLYYVSLISDIKYTAKTLNILLFISSAENTLNTLALPIQINLRKLKTENLALKWNIYIRQKKAVEPLNLGCVDFKNGFMNLHMVADPSQKWCLKQQHVK